MRISDWSSDVCSSDLSPVQPWECDRMGHLNVQFYLARFAEGEKQLLAALGYGPTRRRADAVAIRPLHHRIQFRRENHEGAILTPRSGVRSVAADRLAIRNERYEARSEEHASEIQSLMRSSYAVSCL